MPATPLLSEEDRTQVIGLFTELKTKYGTLDAAIAAGKPTGEIKTAIEKVDADLVKVQEKYQALAARADAIEEKQRQKPGIPEAPKTIGEQFVEDAGFLAFIKSGGRGSYTARVKWPLFGQKDITGLSRSLPEQIPGVFSLARPLIGVRTLIPPGRTTAGAVQYVVESSFTNNAAPVAEGAPKPKSDKLFTPFTLPVETIAHYFKISRQCFDDLPFVVAQIDNNGIQGVQKAEDVQLINGTGTSPQLKGFLPVIGNATAAPVGATLVDAIGIAVFELAAAGYMADGTVVNPTDWGVVAMKKNSQGNYLFANPIDYSGITRIWGTRVVQTASIAPGVFFTGAFQGHSLLLDREEVNVQVATQNEDDFIKNMVTILVEERVVLIIGTPGAFKEGVVPALTL
jgi:HK97 family phage major capsid protein